MIETIDGVPPMPLSWTAPHRERNFLTIHARHQFCTREESRRSVVAVGNAFCAFSKERWTRSWRPRLRQLPQTVRMTIRSCASSATSSRVPSVTCASSASARRAPRRGGP